MGRSALRWFVALAVICAPLAGAGAPAHAATARFVSGWVPYWNDPDGRASFTGAEAPMFEDISPFFSTANSDGQIGSFDTEGFRQTIADAHALGMTVLPSITDGTGKGEMAALLADPARRAAHIQAIVAWVNRFLADGADLDYEGFAFKDGRASWPATQPNWVQFVSELAAALHAQGKKLSITIPPEWGSSSDYWVYSQAQIAPYVDRIRLMVYDWSVSSPGPISPTSWAKQVINFSDTRVDNSKLVLGIPAYGRNWAQKVNSGELCPTDSLRTNSVATADGAALAAAHGVTPVRDASGELRFSWTETVTGILVTPVPAPPYTPEDPATAPMHGGLAGDFQPAQRLGTANQTVTCTIKHTVYYPDATSIRDRAALAKTAGWRGAVIWALGFEDQATRTALYDVAQT